MNMNCIPISLKEKLNNEAKSKCVSVSSLITSILSDYFKLKMHTIFQVSTTGALVAGVFDKEVSVGDLLKHGDFGLGTFAGLDGEMVILDGKVYQAHGNGVVANAPSDAGAPFAVITDFLSDKSGVLNNVASFDDLGKKCDFFRISDNLFYAIRIDGIFSEVMVRAVNPPKSGSSLTDAAQSQSVFTFNDVKGTLVGIWSPAFSSEFSVKGYHFHLISDDHTKGGHVLEVKADNLNIQVEDLNEFRLVLPENELFLKSDLSKNISAELDAAERSH